MPHYDGSNEGSITFIAFFNLEIFKIKGMMTSQIRVNLGPVGNFGHELYCYTIFDSPHKDDSKEGSIIFIAFSNPEIFKFIVIVTSYIRVNLHENWVRQLENLVTYII